MARIRKVTKANRGTNMCYEESTDKKLERNIMEVNSPNIRKLCNNDRNRRILLNLRSYPDLFLTNNFSANLFSAVRKYSISASTQTANNASCDCERKTMSTQTKTWIQEGFKQTNVNFMRQSKSDCSLLQNWKLSKRDSTIEPEQISFSCAFDNLKQCEDKEKIKHVIILHKNENINSTKTTPLKKKTKIMGIKVRTVNKWNSRVYTKKKAKRPFYPYEMSKRLRKTNELKANDDYPCSYNQFIKKIGKYSLTTVAKCSSKLIRIFSDIGISLTESLTNLYQFYESQRCHSFNPVCNCHEFHKKIEQFTSTLNQLEGRLHISQDKICEQQKWINNTDELVGKLNEVEKKLESYDLLKLELADLKKQLNGSSESPHAITGPPPPPPPPLPIFSLATNCASKTFLKVVQNERKLINCDNSRPIITLEDILNVKLKKISVSDRELKPVRSEKIKKMNIRKEEKLDNKKEKQIHNIYR